MGRRREISRERVSRDQMNVTREARYIIRRAQQREPRVVTLGPLVFFSTDSGDAWILDPADSLGRCLATDGVELPSGIQETPESFAIEWNVAYAIEGEAIVFTDNSGRQRVVLGYPTAEITRAARKLRR